MMSFKYPKYIAHRGASGSAPENTLKAFQEAKRLGAEMVEFDVALSADDVPVVIHDDTVDRTTNGSGVVREMDLGELHALDAGQGERIPTLHETLACLAELGLAANIEIKPCTGIEKLTAFKVLQTLGVFQAQLPAVVISSFSSKVLHEVRNMDQAVALAALFNELPDDWQAQVECLDCASINFNQKQATAEQVNLIKSKGFQVLCYTVDNKAQAARLFDMGVDGVFINNL